MRQSMRKITQNRQTQMWKIAETHVTFFLHAKQHLSLQNKNIYLCHLPFVYLKAKLILSQLDKKSSQIRNWFPRSRHSSIDIVTNRKGYQPTSQMPHSINNSAEFRQSKNIYLSWLALWSCMTYESSHNSTERIAKNGTIFLLLNNSILMDRLEIARVT